MAKKQCIIDNCKTEVQVFHLNVCRACYSGLATWRGRPVADKRHRLELIDRLQSRMEFMIGNPQHAPKKLKRR